MSRWSSSLNEAAAELDAIRGAWLLDLAFDSGHARFNDSLKDILVGVDTYYGVGGWGTHDGVEEAVEFVARGARFTLGAVDSALVATVEGLGCQNRAASLYVAMLDEQNALIDTPQLIWSGFMDTFDIAINTDSETGQSIAELTIGCEHRLRNAPAYSRFADADQQGRTSGSDRFFNMLQLVAGYTSTWGGKQSIWNTRGTNTYG